MACKSVETFYCSEEGNKTEIHTYLDWIDWQALHITQYFDLRLTLKNTRVKK